MGTRGAWGFVIEGEEKFGYNHFDSYPDGLGNDLLSALRRVESDELRADAKRLRLVNENATPTPEEIEALGDFADLNVGTQSTNDWYVLLRECQGDLEKTLVSGVMLDGQTFPLDSLFCEWAYVIDLDANVFEVYQGFQHGPVKGRWAESEGRESGYSPVTLVDSFPLDALPESLDEGKYHNDEEEDE